MNLKFCGENYLIDGKAEKTGKPIVFGLATLSELAEFLESRNWKHWKKGNDIDKRNSVTELIDLLHFLASLQIEKCSNRLITIPFDSLTTEYAEKVKIDYNLICRQMETYGNNDQIEFLSLISSLSYLVSVTLKLDILYIHKVDLNIGVDPDAHDTIKITNNFLHLQRMIALCFARVLAYLNNQLGITPKDTLSLYLVKNVLNAFRMKHGYEKGTYIKIWKKSAEDEGMEDNDYIYSLIKDTNILDGNNAEVKDNLLKLMDEEYSKIYKGEK